MSELKTQKNTRRSVRKFIADIEHDRRRSDALVVYEMMQKITGDDGVMWGESIVGFGSYTYKRKGSDEVHEWFPVGFSPRKAALVVYSVPCFPEFKSLVKKLGKVKSTVSCIYITNLEKVDQKVLMEIIKGSVKASKK